MAIEFTSAAKRWYLRNDDTGEVLQGQFPAEGTTLDVANKWARHTALGRTRAIHQFLGAENDKLQFQGRFYQRDATQDIESKLVVLLSFARRSPTLGRPPIVTFWVGNGHLEKTCIVEAISGIQYHEPTLIGQLRHVQFNVQLEEHFPFNIGDAEVFETRYHRVRERDYYEMLAWREYKTPMLGDVLRKRHPTMPLLEPADIVKLPSVEAIRRERVEPKSIVFKTMFGRQDTPQKQLRIAVLNRLRRTHYSHIVR